VLCPSAVDHERVQALLWGRLQGSSHHCRRNHGGAVRLLRSIDQSIGERTSKQNTHTPTRGGGVIFSFFSTFLARVGEGISKGPLAAEGEEQQGDSIPFFLA
jgi:cytochrome b